jgi:ferric-dicitrate binding protein FerR (iron transport regulator)
MSGIAAMLLVAIGWFGLLNNPGNNAGKAMLQVASNQTVVDDAMLPDGTNVTLNTRSVLNYPEQFANDIREVSIFGEAFFEVQSDVLRPFVIHTSGLDIKVVGTSFNVEAYPGAGFVKVAVNTGKVLVYPSGVHPDMGTMLHAGETATYSQASGKLLKGVVDDLNFLSWKTGVLTFRETRLADVFKALEKKYETTFTIDNPDVLNERLTARFESETLDQVLETLALIFELKFESGDAEIIVH